MLLLGALRVLLQKNGGRSLRIEALSILELHTPGLTHVVGHAFGIFTSFVVIIANLAVSPRILC